MTSRRFSPHRRVHPAAALVLAVALIACGASDSNELDADALPRLVAEPEVRIGDFEDPDIGFSRVFAVDVDRDGLIYVLEGLDTQIRVYDVGGRLLRRIGGPGEGPGEFSRAPSFGVVGDTVWAYDAQLGRITLFDRAGSVLSTGRTTGVRIPLPDRFGYVLPRAMRPDGRFTSFFGRVASSRDDPATGVAPTDPIPVPRVLFDATGGVVDTIGWDDGPPPRMVPPPGYGQGRFQVITVGSRRLLVPDPPPDLAQWVTLHDGRIVVDSYAPVTADEATFTVTRIGLANDTVYARTYHTRPIAYTAADLDSSAARGARGGPMLAHGSATVARVRGGGGRRAARNPRGDGVPRVPAGDPLPLARQRRTAVAPARRAGRCRDGPLADPQCGRPSGGRAGTPARPARAVESRRHLLGDRAGRVRRAVAGPLPHRTRLMSGSEDA